MNMQDETMHQRTAAHTTIPAAPGWYLCSPIHDEYGSIVDFTEDPVVAWIVTLEEVCGEMDSCYTQPVVADAPAFPGDPEFLKRPDGRYVEPGEGWYETREKLIYAMQRWDRMQRAVGSAP